ncbi:hypothetical protein [Nocardia sp. NPDC020380]|uniref:hypothetical protein n=1 Tax=Nocardia sp. NPDC020380 TaxID=3364309 RepID=UPI0037A1884F
MTDPRPQTNGPTPETIAPQEDTPATTTVRVLSIDHEARWVTVLSGLKKSVALLPLEQFINDAGELTINVGDEVQVALDSVSAANVARNQLLYAIGREAANVAESQSGNASGALVELARAYVSTKAGDIAALIGMKDVTIGETLCDAAEPIILVRVASTTAEDANTSSVEGAEGEPLAQAKPSAATVARDQLLYAIGGEAVNVAGAQPGNASAALVELARAYALTRETWAPVTRPPSQDRPPLTLTYIDGVPLLTVVKEHQVPLRVEIVDAATNTSRFFAIDKNWTDALIDQTLSVANHQRSGD